MARRRSKGEPRKTRGGADAESEEVLRAKYIDYCSARVCEVFMEVEEERVFELARVAEKKAGLQHGVLNFRDLANLLVEQLLDDLALPDYETWVEDYKRHPEEYDPYLLGLWESGVESPTPHP